MTDGAVTGMVLHRAVPDPPRSAASPAIPERSWREAVKLLRGAGSVVCVCHVSPDGDALGSSLGLAQVLRSLGAQVTVSWGDADWRVPASYRWLPGLELAVEPAAVPADPDVLVVLDTGSRERLGVLASLADRARSVVVVDHHAHNSQPVAGTLLVDAAAAATAVVVTELVARLGAQLDRDAATCLYTGLVTDTGSFAHSVTTPAVHALAAGLLAAGVEPDVVHRHVWGTRPFAAVQLIGLALSRAVLDPTAARGAGLVWTWTTAAEVADAGLDADDVEPVLESLRASAEADVTVTVRQVPDGSWRVSTRSRGVTDVGAACAVLGGGGHRMAAGFTAYDDTPAGVVATLVAALT